MKTQAQAAANLAAKKTLPDFLRNLPPQDAAAAITEALINCGHPPEAVISIGDRISGLAWEAARRKK